MEVMYSNSIYDKYFENSFVSFYGEISDLKTIFYDLEEERIKVNKKVKSLIGNQDESLKALGLNPNVINKKIKDLSYYEYKMILLISAVLISPKIIILNNIDLGVNDKYKSKISRFIKTINATYHINFIIISNNLMFLNKCSKNFMIMKNSIVKYQGDILGAIKGDLVPKPPIIEFIDKANLKGAKLDYTLDNKELLKGIYRSVF